jgi:hypothetical protein
LALLPQELGKEHFLPLRQGRDGVVETIVLVADCNLDIWVVVVAAVIDQPCQVRTAEWYLTPCLGGQPDALSSADCCQPTTEPLWISELVDVLQAALPGELDDVIDVLGRQAALTGDPAKQRLILITHIAPDRLVSRPDSPDKLYRLTVERRFDAI